MDTRDKHARFIREHTELAPVPLVPEIRIHTATEVTPIWNATEAFLATNALGIPFWCVPWAGGQALARHILDHPELVQGKRVVDFGTGSGLVAIAAARVGATVRAVDIDPFAVAACALNAEANGVAFRAECVDVCDEAVDADVLLAGDVWYEGEPARRFQAWFAELKRSSNIAIFTGDPGRAYVPLEVKELGRYDVPTTMDLESKTSLMTRVLAI